MDQLLQLSVLVIVRLVQFIQPFLVPLCFVTAWLVVGLTVWNLVAAAREGISQAKQMHQIPCANCTYFTNSHFLKCPIHPATALSEEAINCSDFEPAKSLGKIKDPTSV
ncbi:hypothetical protein [Pseudanabaena sp. FACHB-2040]|uniref:hypothetical protein n=1 Tax=Pseudanabaena sp. FACHB-2040 TaxID=2692859 RepID=UPI001688BC45|nr:hypothetical protein [Pseudanabaena sp. FACHB-2040]MBD2256800.1 hypothetical protein [Pseudanabaena sp. FACHB-2040]